MKTLKFFIFIIFILTAYSMEAQARGFDVSIQTCSRLQDQNLYRTGECAGIQLDYNFNDSLYMFASHDTVEVIPIQYQFNYLFYGAGFGIKKNLSNNIQLFGQLGYYKIDNTLGYSEGYNEGLHYYFNAMYPTHVGTSFYGHEVRNDNAFGGSFGVTLNYPITKTLSIGALASVRVLKFTEHLYGDLDKAPGINYPMYFIAEGERDFTSLNIGASFKWKF